MQPTAITSLETVKTEAKKYHDLGIAIVPFIISWNEEKNQFDKTNIGTWKKWETEPQTEEEFNNLYWHKDEKDANAFGVILGTKAKNGMYLAVIDYDVKGDIVSEEVKQKGKIILKDFPVTQTEKTANKGIHNVYWSKTKVETDGTFHDTAALELLGSRKLCLMSPSFGYSRVNDNGPSEIPSLEDKFFNVLKKHGFAKTLQTEVEQQLDRSSFSLDKIVDLSKLKREGDDYYGSHPIHDSTTEKNFHVNVKKNTWYCFRHSSGGGSLQYLAVKEGIIKCEDAKKGALRGKKFNQVMQIAASQGLVDKKLLSQSEVNPVVVAKDIMGDFVFVVDEESNELYYYKKDVGVYSNRTEQLLKREIVRRLDENFRNRYYTEINEFIKGFVPLVEMDLQNPEMLALQNGILNVITLELEPFSPKYYTTSKMEVEYDPAIKYDGSENDKFLRQVLEDKKGREQLQEGAGHCLIKKVLVETCFVLIGAGSNGKSIYLITKNDFLGTANVSGLTMQQICYDKFKLVELKGKLANICGDLPTKKLMNTGTYKSVISGERVPISEKHIQGKGSTLAPYAKFFYSANSLPPVENEEDVLAWYRRFCLIEFKKTFDKTNSTPRQELLEKLSTPTEQSAYLNWALEGLQRILENGIISHMPDSDQVRLHYRKRSLATLGFFDECVEITNDPNDWIFTKEFHRKCVTYCRKNNRPSPKEGKFIEYIKDYLHGATKARIRLSPKANPLSAYRYVKIKEFVSDVPLVQGKNNISRIGDFVENNQSGDKLPKNPDTSNTPDTEKAFQIHCFDCGAVLQKNEVYSFGGNRFCRECRLKLESPKKKKYCEHLDLKNAICRHPDGGEIGVNVSLCTLEASKDCSILHPEEGIQK